MMRGLGEQMFKTLLVSIAIGGLRLAAADVPPPPEMPAPKSLTLNDLVFAQFGGGWVSETSTPDGAHMSASLILKEDLTYENGATGKAPNGAALSAIGQGFWSARVSEHGAVEIVLTRDKSDPDPAWVVRPASDGTLIDGDRKWTRGK